MTKYYYNNQLVRTSKKDYKFAMIQEIDGQIVGASCSATKEGASKMLNRLYADMYEREFEILNAKLNAIKNGRSYYMSNVGRASYKIDIKDTDTIEQVENRIKELREEAKQFLETTSVVELEIR